MSNELPSFRYKSSTYNKLNNNELYAYVYTEPLESPNCTATTDTTIEQEQLISVCVYKYVGSVCTLQLHSQPVSEQLKRDSEVLRGNSDECKQGSWNGTPWHGIELIPADYT